MAKMTHPDTTLVVDATPEAQAMYETQGWTRVDGKPAPKSDQ